MSARVNPWPWGIGVFIAFFAIAMASFVFWSLRHRQDLVVRDYYEQELLYNDLMERTARAAGLNALRRDAETHALTIALPPDAADITLTLYRPSDARLDRNIPLTASSTGPIVYSTRDLAPGLWRGTLEWTLHDEGHRATIAFVVE